MDVPLKVIKGDGKGKPRDPRDPAVIARRAA